MTALACEVCRIVVDTEEDRECVIDRPTYAICLCETCRWLAIEQGDVEAAQLAVGE